MYKRQDFPETKIILDAQGRPVEIKPYERNVALLLVATQEHSSETAVDKTEEGGDDVKSSCPLCPGLHT